MNTPTTPPDAGTPDHAQPQHPPADRSNPGNPTPGVTPTTDEPAPQASAGGVPADALLKLMQLEGRVRELPTLPELRFHIVNESRLLFDYRQAFLFELVDTKSGAYRLTAASSLAVVERDAPFVQWIERALRHIAPSGERADQVQELRCRDCDDDTRAGWNEYAMDHNLWVPLRSPKEGHIGGLWLAREAPWSASDRILVDRLAGAYAYSLSVLGAVPRKRDGKRWKWTRIGVLVAMLAVLAYPVHLSVLAPAEVVAVDSLIVSAPLNGVVEDVLVDPNQLVRKDTPLFRYNDTELSNDLELAERELQVRLAEYRTVRRSAFRDEDSKSRLTLVEKEVELAQAEKDYRAELLALSEARAQADGVILFSDRDDWEGRPVSIGERIMTLADPGRVELHVNVPVGDAITFDPGAEVVLYLDADPLHPREANVTHASYQARTLPGEILAYRVLAEFKPGVALPRIGARGVAKVYGERVPLLFYLFRRPFSALRQMVGV